MQVLALVIASTFNCHRKYFHFFAHFFDVIMTIQSSLTKTDVYALLKKKHTTLWPF